MTDKNEDQYILAFDPGGTTGMCLIRFNKNELALSLLAQISDGHMGFYDNLVGVPGGFGTPTTLVSEKWVEHEVKGADRTPLVIEGIQYAFWPDQVIYQTPDMKHMITDDDLKELGVWTPGKPHQMDALRHALIFLRNAMHEPTLQMLGNGEQMPQDGDGEPGGEPNQIETGADQGDQGQGDQGRVETGDEVFETAEHQDRGERGDESTGGLSAALTQLMEGVENDEDQKTMEQRVREVYDRERDTDGAFSGYAADVGAERTMLIDEDF